VPFGKTLCKHPEALPITAMNSFPSSRILVDVPRQRLLLHSESGSVEASWPVSTSKFGLGSAEGSLRTPTGRFRIAEKIGAGAPLWMIFRSRIPTGTLAVPGGEEDHVLTRILWLEGLDPENANTRDRYIYIHGTNQEELIGTPASHGCIRLRNHEMIELYNRVKSGDSIVIKA
jgi:lipoprotein-anchoring transpeptidase ErfK/SrfK